MRVDGILPKILVGSCPVSRADIDQLKADFGVTGVLNLQTEDDFRYMGIDLAGPGDALSQHGHRRAAQSGPRF